MKLLLVLFTISILPVLAVAGPEDHMNESCYTATTKTPSSVPSTFCLDSAQLVSQNTYLMTSGTYSNVPGSLIVKSIMYVTEDKVKFEAEATIVNVWNSGCGDGELAVLTIKGTSEIGQSEEINPKELNFSVSYSSTNDTCHSHPQLEAFNYILSK
ncbi:MAG: hypothetical protein H7281_15450 [Bacteriovorax sp.]|nr:hypothetical protein [Bacteriovorax sp.]